MDKETFLIGCFILTLNAVCSGKPQQGPNFIHEPASRVDFTNSSGASVVCSSRGNPPPIITWQKMDGSEVVAVSGLRELKPDGTLVFPPFRPSRYRQDVHAATYRCLATNSVGSIRSRDIHVRAVLLQPYDIRVYDQFVPRGNTAIMRCHVPAVVRDYVSVVLWVRDDGITIGPPGISSDKYAVLHSGELLIRNTEPSDAFRGYKCQTRHRLTNELITSSSAGQLIVTEPHSSLSPKVIENRSPRRAKVGDTVYLPCVGQGVPKPQSFWYKKQGNSLRSLSENHRGNHELLTFRKVSVQDGGGYICVVNNTVGREEFSTELVVTAPLSAHIQPATQLADVGRRASLTCRVSGHPQPTVSWFKDGRLLTFSSRVTSVSRDVVQIFTVQREDKGMYQCLATNELESYQATAEINIGEDAPVFTSTFPEVTTRPSMPLSLKCSASGKPLPQITWSLDGMAVPEAYHIRIGDYVSTEYTVNSYVNISSASVEDGGLYFCSATNDVGKVSHSARVNIFGPPYIRPMKNVSALAGKEVTLHCPVAGFPIEKIAWERESRRLPQSHRQHVYANGTLLLKQVLRSSDSGSYTCFAADKQGRTARRDVHVSVLIPPAVEPFAFPKDLTEGKRAGVACVVSAGDLPISIRWVKDGQTLADELKASISNANDFTSFLSFSTVQQSHNGRYTCVASNPVASANYTATMTVHVPPKWRVEPNDKSAVLGESVTFDCQADGFPAPVIRWKRATGSDQGNFEVIISSANIQIRENGSLTIREVNKEDSGSYMCQATNGVGPGLSTVVHLKVHVAAHFGKRFEAQSIRKGEGLMLACEAKGEKPITIVWTKDRHSFDPHMETRYILEEEDLDEAIKSVIRVPSADRRDSALFTCVAENTYGKDEITYQVIVQEPPDKPRNPSILAKGSRSFSVSWSHPYSGNSPLSAYILEYTRNTDPWEQSKKVNVEGSVNEFTVQNLIPQTTYRVRLFAENALGIGEPSELMTVTTEEEAPNGPPQEIRVTATSSKSLQVSWKPPSRKDWHGTVQGYYVGVKPYAGTEPFSYKTVEVRDSGTQECEINNLERHTKFVVVVQAFNAKGAGPTSAEVLEETLEFDPPIAPRLAVVSQTSTSIHVTWDSLEEDGEPVGGYILFYKTEESEWDEVTIPAERSSFNAQNLQCGKRYQLYIVAFNSAGRGQPSEVVPAKTDGSVPLAPDKSVLLSTNSSAVTLHLTSWESSTCPITFFVVQYKPRDQREWILLSNNILPAQKVVVVGDLSPATWYALLMTAHNDAGSTEAEYIFATLTLTGGTVPPLAISPDPGRELAQQLKIIIPIVCTTIVLVLIVTVSCVILIKRRNHNYANANNYQQAEEVRDQEVSKNLDTVPMTVWEKRPRTTADGRLLNQSREQLYFPSPYATSRVSMYSEYETGGGVGRDVGVGGGGGDRVAVAANQLSWKVPPGAPGHPHPTHERIEHTYDVPFLRRQHHVPSETSEASISDRMIDKKYFITESLCLQEAVVDLPPEHCDRPRSAVVPSTAIGAFVNSEQHFGYKPSRAHQRRARHRSEPRLRPLTHRPQRPRYSDGESDENGYSYSDVEESGVFHNCEEPEMSETESDRHLRALYYQRRNLQ